MEDGPSLFSTSLRSEMMLTRDLSLPALLESVMWGARALHYLHTEKHIMHGDLKSGNILVVGKICDFGVTFPINSEGKMSNPDTRYTGTVAWSPMEVIKEEVTSKADIFAFGLVLYEMLALHSPHVDKLVVPDSDEEDGDADDSMYVEAFRAALGIGPPLPDSVNLDQSYRTVLELPMRILLPRRYLLWWRTRRTWMTAFSV